MIETKHKIILALAVLLLVGGSLIPEGDGDPLLPETEAWTNGKPKLLIVENSEKRGVNQGIAINSAKWRDPFYKAGGELIIFDPENDKGETATLTAEHPWFPKAERRVRQDLTPYFVYAAQGKVSVGHIKESETGIEEFENKIISRLPK